MPRDAYLLGSGPMRAEDIIRAGAAVDEALTLRSLHDGAAVQLVGDDYSAVVTIGNARLLTDGEEVERLVPMAPAISGPVWFVEAFVPWDNDGEPGLAILRELAMSTNAALIIEDGT
jgi:hypothetical protein